MKNYFDNFLSEIDKFLSLDLENYISSLEIEYESEKEFDQPKDFTNTQPPIYSNDELSYDKPRYRPIFLKRIGMTEERIVRLFIQ